MDRWVIGSSFDTVFEFDYSVQAEDMRSLYEKAKRDQWNAARDIAWDTPGTDDGRILADELIDIYGSPLWERMSEAERVELNRRISAWRLSVLLYGEQGAMLACSQLVNIVAGPIRNSSRPPRSWTRPVTTRSSSATCRSGWAGCTTRCPRTSGSSSTPS